jgi:hypothetical protein
VSEVDDTFDLGGQEAAREAAQKKREREENQLDTDYLNVLQTNAGQRLFIDLIKPLWRSSYSGAREDTDFREGERNVALRVWARLARVAPTLAPKIIEEALR